MNWRKHLLIYFSLTLFLWLLSIGLKQLGLSLHPYFIGILAFYFVVASLITLIHALALQAEDKSPVVLLGGVVIRLILTIFFMVFALLFGVVEHEVFILNTAVLYIPYLIFEIILLLPNLRPNSEENL